MRLKVERFLLVTFLVASVISFGVPAFAKTTLQFWLMDQGWVYPDTLKSLAERFEAANPDIDVETTIMPGARFEETMVNHVLAGTAPDLAFFNRTRVIEWGAEGAFEALNQYLSDEVIADLNPTLLQEVTLKGDIWAAPLSFDMRGLMWNNRLLSEAGLDNVAGPQTLAELRDFTSKLTRKNQEGNIEQLGFFPYNNN